VSGTKAIPKTAAFETMWTIEKRAPKIIAFKKASRRGVPISARVTAKPKFVIKSYVSVRKAPKTAVSRQDPTVYGPTLLRLYIPPPIPTMTIPTIWNGSIIPENPQGERKPLMSITRTPSAAPNKIPKTAPTRKTMSDVNSMFGGLGVT